ncbi:YrrS family protein [Piscibacillus halophilus]|uniref:DUF1510 domain-containing protein n=1 Tax=Piscibacillus halophilus TaxID=571933 RepID=A0A1H9BSH9_9BACI|nr:YrrS family protein [Piscibacillus halophilus]SEP91799.1 Protein of unknown function [Piscibacillus halophilus]
MSFDNYDSRSDRYEKRRKNTKLTNLLIVLAVLLSAFLFGMLVFGGGDEEDEVQQDESVEPENEQEESIQEDDSESETNPEGDTSDDSSEEMNEEETEEEDMEDENEERETSPGDGEEVREVIEQDWQPYPTEQEEPHTIDLNNGSQDRQEIEQAIAQAVQVSRDDLEYWWLESGGVPDQVIGYVEDKSNQEYYRIPLKWIENEGWQPQRVDVLFENLGQQKLEGQ